MSSGQKKLLEQFQSGELTPEECLKLLNVSKNNSYYKVSQKGAISFYNVGRSRPITLYQSEIESILELIMPDEWVFNETYQKFLDDNKDKISRKD
mgnify:CR=1 FL=1